MSFYDWIESTAVGTWVRESPWGFPGGLIVHVWSMAFIGGMSLLVALAIFGRAPRLLPALLGRYLPVTWSAFGISLLSGLVLMATYPDKVLGNVVFWLKLVFIAMALALVTSVQRRCMALSSIDAAPFPAALKLRAALILLAWFCAIITGRLLYYTY